jgi:hypothetical protein
MLEVWKKAWIFAQVRIVPDLFQRIGKQRRNPRREKKQLVARKIKNKK